MPLQECARVALSFVAHFRLNARVPSENAEQRKLAEIMFTDIVGSSVLSQRDEKLAQKFRTEINARCVHSSHLPND